MAIHASAIVQEGATLGDDVDIGPFCLVGRNVVLGDRVRLMSHVVVDGHTRIGERTIVHPQSVLGGGGQIRKDDFAEGRLSIGSDCVIREAVTMNVGSRSGRGITSVGNNGYFMAYSHIGHDCRVEDDVTFANGATLAGHVHIGQGVIFGGLSAVQQFGRVGQGAMIGGVTGVNTDVIPYGIATGDHAVLGGLNIVGLKRRGVSRAAIHATRAAFRAIFLDGVGSLFERARRARVTWPEVAPVQEIVDFVLADAKRGLCVADPARVRPDEH